jgi:hypothetical protein
MTGTAWAPKCHIIARLRIKTFDGFFEPSSFIFFARMPLPRENTPRSIMCANIRLHGGWYAPCELPRTCSFSRLTVGLWSHAKKHPAEESRTTHTLFCLQT